jgi:ribosomal protein L37AE/L43A
MSPATIAEGEPEGLGTIAASVDGFATCPSCHTADASVTNAAVGAGADWRCQRCGQRWDGRRLAAVAAYAKWDADYRAASAARTTAG